MTLSLLLVAMGVCVGGGVVSLVVPSRRGALVIGTVSCVVGCGLGAAASGFALLTRRIEALDLAWTLPLGGVRLGVDGLSAFFLLCVFTVSGLAALYGAGYLRPELGRRRLGPVVFFFNLLVSALAAVLLARDGVLFLVVWEIMSLAGFFLVTFDDEHREVRRAGLVYLIASQLGVVALFVLFGLLAEHAHDFGFAAFASAGPPTLKSACFVLALLGFGAKAGFWLLHIWLPEAHTAAPSHVSAVMSGAMIKMGVYGLLRVLTWLGPPPPWWGITLVAIGAASGILGVLHALGQHDLKRLLAYCSVENIGIIALGIGLGLLGQSTGQGTMAFLGYGGAVLHTLNHGLFKGLLFQGAGSVVLATGTREIDTLGGLSRKLPTTAFTFLVGSIAISGLPPLNGFVSEWLIYVAAFHGKALKDAGVVAALAVVPALALIGGLAVACFVKAYGVVFLGEPRSDSGRKAAGDTPLPMRIAMILGAMSCIVIGLLPELALRLIQYPAEQLSGTEAPVPAGLLGPITRLGAVLGGLCGLFAVCRHLLLRRREVAVGPTWGCGYEAPTPRMQYTASSFAEPVLGPFGAVLQRKLEGQLPEGYFPHAAELTDHLGDAAGERVLIPAVRKSLAALSRLQGLQHGRLQLYLVYILVTVVVVLVWQLSGE